MSSQTGKVLFGMSVIGALGAITLSPSGGRKSDEWWFSSDIPIGGRLVYHVDEEVVTTDGPTITRSASTGEFTLEVKDAGDPTRRRIRLQAPDDSHSRAGLVNQWVQLVRLLSAEGTTLTPTDVLLRDQPLLRGPWRDGDRMTLAGGVIFLGMFAVVAHGEVVSASPDQAHLVFDFWGGGPLPVFDGKVDVRFVSDDRGLKRFHAKWKLTTDRDVVVEGELDVTRTKLIQPGE